MIAYLKARFAEVSSKFAGLMTAVLAACGVANAYGAPWSKIAFGAALVMPLYLFLKPDPKTLDAPAAAQKIADAAQDAADKVAG